MTSSTTPSSSTPTPNQVSPGPACPVVFVVDKNGLPLMPTHPAKARKFLTLGRSDVFCMNPFTIRLLDREGGDVQEVELKVDPGSKVTGFAMVTRGAMRGRFVLCAWELTHRGQAIREALLSRSQYRRGRRSRKTRYRAARYNNRTRAPGWLAPSLCSRVDNVVAFARKMRRVVPVTSIPVEQVRFDTQLLENPNIQGVQYQQGTLAGYEVREYLLLKWQHQCSYCQKKDLPLQIEHIQARSKGGSDRISNLCLACEPCNRKKGVLAIEVFLKNKPELLAKIKRQAKAPLKDAAAVNSTRLAMVKELEVLGLPVSTGTGGQTKFHRTQQGYPKAHWIDAACVGETGDRVAIGHLREITAIQAKGRGNRQMCKSDKFGFPRGSAKSVKRVRGFQTGDRVRLSQPAGKYQGVHEGVVAIRANEMFDLTCARGKITAPYSRFTLLARFDGYTYAMAPPPRLVWNGAG